MFRFPLILGCSVLLSMKCEQIHLSTILTTAVCIVTLNFFSVLFSFRYLGIRLSLIFITFFVNTRNRGMRWHGAFFSLLGVCMCSYPWVKATSLMPNAQMHFFTLFMLVFFLFKCTRDVLMKWKTKRHKQTINKYSIKLLLNPSWFCAWPWTADRIAC